MAQPPAGRAGACAAAQRGAHGPGPRRGCGDAAYRTLYKALRSGIYRTLGQLAQAAGLEDAQARAGLHAFCQLGLIDYAPSPLRYTIRPAVKCSLGDSPMLAALRAVAGGA